MIIMARVITARINDMEMTIRNYINWHINHIMIAKPLHKKDFRIQKQTLSPLPHNPTYITKMKHPISVTYAIKGAQKTRKSVSSILQNQ